MTRRQIWKMAAVLYQRAVVLRGMSLHEEAIILENLGKAYNETANDDTLWDAAKEKQ